MFAGAPVFDVRWSPRGDMLLLAVIDLTRGDRDGRAARMLFGLAPDAPVLYPDKGDNVISTESPDDPLDLEAISDVAQTPFRPCFMFRRSPDSIFLELRQIFVSNFAANGDSS